jgi:pyruvate dehydrogenase E2 component (dihydrolipoamide acetyltransferase)
MAKEVRLPQLGQTMEEGTIVGCMVGVGDEVKKGDIIFEVETDKATLEMESPANGFVKHILAEVGQTLPVGGVLMILGERNEEVPQSFIASLKSGVPAAGSKPSAPVVEPAKLETKQDKLPGKVKASPRAKKLAEDLGVDLSTVTGTGPAGKITEEDVKKAALLKPKAAAEDITEVKLGATIPVTKNQKLVAERMVKSKREIPCFYLTVKANVTSLVQLRTKLNETGQVKISYNDFIICAVAMGLEKFPIMTGQLDGDNIKLPDTVNIGLAISTPKGLIVPVVKDADKKNVKQIAAETRLLIEKAQNETVKLTDLEGACITVSNLGGFGIESFIPIVIPGQCSILGVGQITDTCVPDNDGFAVRKLMSLTLSVDHKVANGVYASQFLDFVRKLLEDTSTFE